MRRLSLALVISSIALALAADVIDGIKLGSEKSEAAHAFSDKHAVSYAEKGAQGHPCRRIKKPDAARWRTEAMKFRLKVAKDAPTYLTCRLWGGDVSHDHLFCTIDGKMLGQMHLGEYDILDYESCWPRDSNRETADAEHFGAFTYRTFLLPANLTRGRESVEIAVYASGHVWGYGTNFEQFQKMVLHDSRGLYMFVTHTEPMERCFLSAGDAKPARNALEVAKEPDMDSLRKRVDEHLAFLMTPGVLRGRRNDIGLLAEAYSTKGCVAYRNPDAVKSIVDAVDAEAADERTSPGSVVSEGTWIGAGRSAVGVGRLGAEALAPFLNDSRRSAWRELFLKSVDYLTTHRRYFANQMQIIDTNAHWCNRALKICDEKAGPPIETTAKYVRQAMGLEPAPNGYLALTAKGLSKEDGYVGSYGESTIWASANAYEATGDDALLGQLVKATKARLFMRYPGVRRDGRRVARLEAQVSWRNEHFPPPPTYLTNNGDLRNAVLSRSPSVIGAVRDMYDDGVLAEYARDFKGSDLNALRFLADWPKVKAAIDKFGDKLPHLPCFMDRDYAWCDSEDGIAVVKRGDEMLFVEAYWRARGGINNLAKVHYVRPDSEFVATVDCEERYERKDAHAERIGDWFQYGWMGKLYGGYRDDFGTGEHWPPKNATADLERPVAENGGRAEFYVVRYGSYIVAINDSTKGRSYELDVPPGNWKILSSGEDRAAKGTAPVEPKKCVALFLEQK